MTKIALLGDRETATYFRISGLRRSKYVKDRPEAEQAFAKFLADDSISLILVTEPVMEWVQPLVAKHRKEYPLVMAIPTKKGPKSTVDTLAQLVKRTVGIELKVKS
ncbi:V-type ATP synthase subunit F [Candidatus Bathyarchaeota archaeon]|jgi:vacuolar-type H+-ATPase subunit F/Vma7|nr:V-type ATP synthase subunit F [Candidatus Bathyarchaeota archaeon]